MERATITVRGQVQRVGFRAWTRSQAIDLGLVGSVRNVPSGMVEICAQGPQESIERLEDLVRERPSTTDRPGQIQGSTIQWSDVQEDLTGFAEH